MIISSKSIPARFDVMTVWSFILVRPESRDESTLMPHEMLQCREQCIYGVLPWLLLYAVSVRLRITAEVRGYRAHVATDVISPKYVATLLMQYGVEMNYEQAVCLLSEG